MCIATTVFPWVLAVAPTYLREFDSHDPAEPNLNTRRFARRSETRSGMVRIDIQLPPEQANMVWEAILAAMDAGLRHIYNTTNHAPWDPATNS